MVLAPATDDQLATARKMASAVDGASEQGPAADPEFMQTLFSRLLMALGTINANFVPVLLAVNAVTENVDFAACLLGSATGTCRVSPKTSENSQIFVFSAVQTSNLAIETTVHVYKLPGSVGTLKYAEYGR